MPGGDQMLDSGDEGDEGNDGSRSRSRSRSPIYRENDGGDIDLGNLSPRSERISKIVGAVVAAQLAPVKKSINKLMDSTSQMKGHTEQNKRALMDLRKSSLSVEEQLKKSTKQNPKSTLNTHVIGKLYEIAFRKLKTASKKEEVQLAAVTELKDRGAIDVTDEDAVKKVVGTEYSHLKAHLRSLISEDLSSGNDVNFPKAEKYLRHHLQLATLDEANYQYLTIMALGAAKFENAKPVLLGDADKENKKKIQKNVDNYWSWVTMKFTKYEDDGITQGNKLKNIVNNVGYQAKKTDGAVSRRDSGD